MSIENHKWSDHLSRPKAASWDDGTITIHLSEERGSGMELNKADSQAIAKHFNQDLVTKIKELIKFNSVMPYKGEKGDEVVRVEDLQDLIKELDNE